MALWWSCWKGPFKLPISLPIWHRGKETEKIHSNWPYIWSPFLYRGMEKAIPVTLLFWVCLLDWWQIHVNCLCDQFCVGERYIHLCVLCEYCIFKTFEGSTHLCIHCGSIIMYEIWKWTSKDKMQYNIKR